MVWGAQWCDVHGGRGLPKKVKKVKKDLPHPFQFLTQTYPIVIIPYLFCNFNQAAVGVGFRWQPISIGPRCLGISFHPPPPPPPIFCT